MRVNILVGLAALSISGMLRAEPPPLLKSADAAALAQEVSGSAAKRTVQGLSLHHRMRGSHGYQAAAELIRDRAIAYGLDEVEIIALPADGKIFYGTQRSRPAWNASFAELWEQRLEGDRWSDFERIAAWSDEPISLAQDSVSGIAEAELVDVGAGSAESDYAGRDVRGKLVLISAQPEEAAALAVTRHGAAGIVSWAQNQKQGWWGEDQGLVRWGHLNTWKDPAFAFMVSPARARAWQERLRRGGAVRLRAKVDAGRSAGEYLIPTAVIPGRDRSREIVYSCHLDHPSPGANDNASGCAGILEAARTIKRQIANGRLPQPLRTIRFIWPCEIECSIALLNGRPEFARRTLATIHLDMIGGDAEKTKSILRVHGSPPSLPTFVNDVGFAIGNWVNDQSLTFADTGHADWPLIDAEGDKRALQALVGGFSEGSDNVVWTEGSWRIPVIYIADWPDRYIHTQRDIPENLDATKLKRAIFIAAASGWYLANLTQPDVPALERVMRSERLGRRAAFLRKDATQDKSAARYLNRAELEETASLARFGLTSSSATAPSETVPSEPGLTYRRRGEPKGPMSGFGYSWIEDRLEQRGLARPLLLDRAAPRDGASFAFEALNLVDGRRSVDDIADQLSVTVGPVPTNEVAAYLEALAALGLLERL